MRGMYTTEAQRQAELMKAAVERDHPGSLLRLRHDPIGELQLWRDLSISMVQETSTDVGCSVAGSYHPSPPTLVVTRSLSTARRRFTVLHELGHHLQQTDIDLGNVMFNFSDPDVFEEQACDAFAAAVLLPDDELANQISPRGPTAQDVADLYNLHSSASREACCVWAARHLIGSGIVVLLDNSGVVLFAAARSFIPPAKKSDQSATPLIEAALRNPGVGASRDETFIRYRNGATSESLYGQARWFDERYLVAVLVTDHAAWKPLALPRPFTVQGASSRWWTCETCADSFTIGERCPRCREPRCTHGHCGCDVARAAKDKTCTECFCVLHPARFAEGSAVCRDCSA